MSTYSDFACKDIVDEKKEIKYCRTIKEVIENVSNGDSEIGLVAAENKLAGSVHETYDSLWEYGDVEVVYEYDLTITHVLAALRDIPISKLSTILSHSQPLSQCSRFLEKNRNLRRVSVASTADAVVQLNHKNCAIVPKRAAQSANLHILSEEVCNAKDNFTRFYVIQKRKNVEDNKVKFIEKSQQRTISNYLKKSISVEKEIIRTSLAVELLKTKAGALLKVLQFFADENINLLKLESKPVGDRGDVIFFIDAEGQMSVSQIERLEKLVAILKVFGVVRKLSVEN